MYGYGGRDVFGSVVKMKIKCPADSGCEYIHDFEHMYTDFSRGLKGYVQAVKGHFQLR